jgi:transposase
MDKITRIGMDTSKSVFQLHGVNAAEEPILRKKLTRSRMVEFFKSQPPTVVGIEACGGSHHWAQLLGSFGHTVKLVAPHLVKPYVKRGKNDAADAEALCEAMSRPTMRFVPAKSAEHRAALMMIGMRNRLVNNRTQLTNAIRGFAMEFGIIIAAGPSRTEALLEKILADDTLPELAHEIFALHGREYRRLRLEIEKLDDRLMEWNRLNECSRRLAQIPGVGPIGAALLMLKTPHPKLFKSGRDFAAWIGLTPRDHSTAGKVKLGGITRAGDQHLRSVLVVGATSVIRHVRKLEGPNVNPWLLGLIERKKPKVVAVALANKMARIAWKLMVTGETYRKHGLVPPLANAA